MNKIHKSQYNESLGTWVAVPEIAKGRGKATGVAKEIPMTPSLPKFAVSALTLALLQVVSVSAYAGGGVSTSSTCVIDEDGVTCGETAYSSPINNVQYPDQGVAAIGQNVYASMSTAIGNNVTVGLEEEKNRLKKALSDGVYKDDIKSYYTDSVKNSIGIGDNIKINKSNSLGIGTDITTTASDSISLGKSIDVNTSNTVAIGNNIKKTKENSVFLGNKSGYIEDNSDLENASIASLGNTKDAGTAKVKLLEGIDYAGINNTIGVVSVGNSEGTRRIQGVAPGLVSEKSADAINGAQLYAAYDVINTNEENINTNKENIDTNTVDIIDLKKGWNIGKVAASDVASLKTTEETQQIKPGNTVNFADSDTISVALKKDSKDKVAVQFDINPDQVRDKISTKLPIVYTTNDKNGDIVQRVGDKWYKVSEIEKAKRENTELTGGIDGSQIIASARHPSAKPNQRGDALPLSNIAKGALGLDSTDAINGSQLFEVTEKIKKGWNIGKITDAETLDKIKDIKETDGDKNIAFGDSVKFVPSEEVSVELKSVEPKKVAGKTEEGGKTVAVQIGLNKGKVHADTVTQLPVVYTDKDGNIVQRGAGNKWYKSSEVVKANGDYTGLKGIGDNEIIAAIHNPVGKDISGNPFELTNLANGLVSDGSNYAVNGGQLFAERERLATYLGGGAKAIPGSLDNAMHDGDFQVPTFTVNKANGDVYQIGTGAGAKNAVAHNVGDALENLNKYVNEGIKVSANKAGGKKLAPTETLNFANGTNTTATVEKDDSTGTVTVKVNVDSDAIAGNVLTQSQTQGPVIYTVKNGNEENAPVVKIENQWYLAADVEKGKLTAGAKPLENPIIKASLRNPTGASKASAGDAYVLNNIADGSEPLDAINKRQFDYAVVYGDSANPNYAEKADHSFVSFKGKPVEVLDNVTKGGTTKVGTGTQLRNVASAGDIKLASNAGHAVNAADLKYHVDSLTEKGLDFAGDTGGSVHKKLGETLNINGGDNITVAASNGGLKISIKNDPTFTGKVTAEGGIVAGKSNPIKINTDGAGEIHGLTNVDIEKDGESLLDNGAKGTAATEAQLVKVLAKINGKIGDNDERITEGRVFTGDIGDEVKVGLGNALAVNGGITDESKLSDNNIGVVTKENGLEIKLGKELNGINSIELTASEPNGGNGGNGTPTVTTELNNNGIRIKPSAVDGKEVALTDAGLDNGGNKIVDVGDGLIAKDSKDAVNGGQLLDQIEAVKSIIGGPVTYDNSSNKYVVSNTDRDGEPTDGIGGTGERTIDAAIKAVKDQKETRYVAGKNIDITPDSQKAGTKVISTADNVEFNSVKIIGTNPNKTVKINGDGIDAGDMKVRNVAAGRIAPLSQDAINGSQLYQVKQDINDVDKRARSGIASAMASAGLPQAYLPGKSMVGAAASNYRGETAIAVGISSISDNGKWLVKADANANRKDFGVSLGVGYQW